MGIRRWIAAGLVSEESEVDLGEIKRWSEKEGKLAAFEQISGRLAGEGAKG